MLFRSIRWRIATPYVLLILLIMAGLALFLSSLVREAYLDNLESELQAEALLLSEAIEPVLSAGGDLDPLVRHYADLLGVRVTVIGLDGIVLGESNTDRAEMDNHLYRPEVRAALAEGQGRSIRYSNTMGYDMMYVALLVMAPGGQEQGIVRVSLTLREVEAGITQLRGAVLLATMVAAALAVLLALFVAQRTARPIRQLTRVADRMAAGELGARLFPSTRDEVGQLTRAFNDMANYLQQQMATLSRERSRLAAVMTHMADGVVIADDAGQVLLINPAATALLETTEQRALQASLAQVVRHHQLIELWKRCQESGQEQIEVIELGRRGVFLQAIASPFQEANRQGFLMVLQDLTRIRRLETVRRDFISNVSHELRTPLASLRALVDTLRGGALDDPPAAQRFLDRIETEVDALTQTVQELLELSRIESGQVPLNRRSVPLAELIISPVDRLRPQAERAGLQLVLSLPGDPPEIWADAERIRQVVTNLVHNAIKFTPPGGKIEVQASLGEGQVIISVRDSGVGIPADDLPRIFERFYKADRARSGGGTGLGLAICKHIVQAHRGEIWAESVEGEGSTFFFSLPRVDETFTPS